MSNTVVNTNVSALNSHRAILSVGGRQARSAERLSSGMRINRAADDAAGLAISEGMRNQIRGLDQAVRNSQDGISLVQTAEGALEEVHRILERSRVLTNQASNDTYDAHDRGLIEAEIAQLNDELARIVETTQFNGMNILQGNGQSAHDITIGSDIVVDRDAAGLATGLRNADGQVVTHFHADGRAAAVGMDSGRVDEDGDAILWTAALLTEAGFRAATITAETATAPMQITFAAVAGTAIGAETLTTHLGTGRLAEGTVLVSDGGTGAGQWSLQDANGREITSIRDEHGRERQVIFAANGEISFGATDDIPAITNATFEELTETGAAVFGIQAGANSGQRIDITLENMNSTVVSTFDDFAQAFIAAFESGEYMSALIDTIDDIITSVSVQRANLGAYQNRLEHTINNTRVASENLSAANSRIRDTDMAAEMMAYTQANVLQQAGMSMLAQANMAPQNILQLVG